MTQEVYIRLWENLARVEIARAKLWLLRVTRNACLDRLRRRTLEREFVQQASAQEPADNPMDMLAQERRSALLQDAVSGLAEPYRSLIILRDIHQHNYQDIAKLLELSLDQVKVYLYRARQQLKARLETMEI